MELNIKVTSTTKSLLKNYYAEELLKTIPHDYELNNNIIKIYSDKIKPATLISISVDLSEQIYSWLDAIAKNNNIPIALLFNFLIETVADCSRIHTKKIKQALDCYYYSATYDKNLFSQILSEYALSGFYDEKTGLSEESVAYFLANSNKRTKYSEQL